MNKKCQIFTPEEYVIKMLDNIGYKKNLFGKKIIEPSCGNGNILSIIVERYIKSSIKDNTSIDIIKNGLEADIFGFEIDKTHYLDCINNLNEIAEKYHIFDITWSIYNKDVLSFDLQIKFDYVVGNPPYISYKNLDLDTRLYVKENFETCSEGKFDYCYAFIELGIKLLNNTGKMIYLIPSSVFKNVFANKLRIYMLSNLTSIYDYKTRKIFNALTSSAIILFDKSKKSKIIKYFDEDNNENYQINKNKLSSKWIFKNGKVVADENINIKKFGDFFHAFLSIATLYNKAYVINKKSDIYSTIEKTLIKPTASPRSLNNKQEEVIIFPYQYANNNLVRYSKDEFSQSFPIGSAYLKLYEDKLTARDADDSTKWFEYGRSQALRHLNQDKLLLSTVITNSVKVYCLDSNVIPYSGIIIVSKGQYPLSFAKNILESNAFLNYVKEIGINASGTSLRITAKDINNFSINI